MSDRRDVTIPAGINTLDDFRRWVLAEDFPEWVRPAYLGGEVHGDMSPERYGFHSAVKAAISRALQGFAYDGGRGIYFPDGMLLVNRPGDVTNHPDGMFAWHETVAAGRAGFVPNADGRDSAELSGSPDLVIEVISPSSAQKDRVALMDRYFRAGVPEYWIIVARDDDEIELTIYSPGATQYEAQEQTVDGWLPSPALRQEVSLVRRINRSGRWSYRLDMKDRP